MWAFTEHGCEREAVPGSQCAQVRCVCCSGRAGSSMVGGVTAGCVEGFKLLVTASGLKDQPRVLVYCVLRGEEEGPFEPSAAIRHRVRVVEI